MRTSARWDRPGQLFPPALCEIVEKGHFASNHERCLLNSSCQCGMFMSSHSSCAARSLPLLHSRTWRN
jgi:hypothetical protein